MRHTIKISHKICEVAFRYPRLSTDRVTAEANRLEWVTPGHPLFESFKAEGRQMIVSSRAKADP